MKDTKMFHVRRTGYVEYYVPAEYDQYIDTNGSADKHADPPQIAYLPDGWVAIRYDSADAGGYDVAGFVAYLQNPADLLSFLTGKPAERALEEFITAIKESCPELLEKVMKGQE